MARELRPLVRALALPVITPGAAWRSDSVTVAIVGVGPAAAAAGAAAVCEAFEPDRILVVGVAGALAPTLRIGDIVSPELVVAAAGGQAYRPTAPSASARRGTLVTVGTIGEPVPAGAAAVDMETAAIAAVCDDHGVAWDVRRGISDLPGTLRTAAVALVRPDGRTDAGAVARLLVRRPQEAARLARLGRDARRAIASVTRAALATVEEVAAR